MEEKLFFKFTTNKKYLRQYYRLRKMIYEIDLGIPLSSFSDSFDSISHTLVVRLKEKCVGGCRLTVCEAGSNRLLPSESEEFRLKNLAPELELDKYSYAEYSRLILLPDYRDGKVSEKIYKQLNRKARQLGVRYVFVIAQKSHARLYISSYRRLGYKVKMLSNVNIPKNINDRYNGVAECIIMMDMSSRYQTAVAAQPEAVVELHMA